jgi:hypothetical protein
MSAFPYEVCSAGVLTSAKQRRRALNTQNRTQNWAAAGFGSWTVTKRAGLDAAWSVGRPGRPLTWVV